MAAGARPSAARPAWSPMPTCGVLARARASVGAIRSCAALSAVFGEREVDGRVGLQDAEAGHAVQVLLLAGAGGAGAVGVEQGVAGEAQEVVQLG